MRPRRFLCCPWPAWLPCPPGLVAARIRLLEVRCRLLEVRCSEPLLLGEGKLYCRPWAGCSSRRQRANKHQDSDQPRQPAAHSLLTPGSTALSPLMPRKNAKGTRPVVTSMKAAMYSTAGQAPGSHGQQEASSCSRVPADKQPTASIRRLITSNHSPCPLIPLPPPAHQCKTK